MNLRTEPFNGSQTRIFGFRVSLAHHLAVVVLCVLATTAQALEWAEFRGPFGDGRTAAPGDNKVLGLPLQWSETNNVKWKTEIPYRGWSTPVVLGKQVWLTTA